MLLRLTRPVAHLSFAPFWYVYTIQLYYCTTLLYVKVYYVYWYASICNTHVCMSFSWLCFKVFVRHIFITFMLSIIITKDNILVTLPIASSIGAWNWLFVGMWYLHWKFVRKLYIFLWLYQNHFFIVNQTKLTSVMTHTIGSLKF